MNIVRENLDNGTIRYSVTVGEADYTEAVDKTLRGYRRKANIPGFRPGMVPMGIINKMYRKGAVAEEAYRAANKAVAEDIKATETKTLGDLIPSESQPELDFDNNTEHTFVFEIGQAPEFTIALDKKDKVVKYGIKVSAEMLTGYKENFLRRFGKLEDVDTVTKDEALTVTLDQPEMKIEDAYVGLIGMSEEERAPFIGKKVGDKLEVNVNDLYKTPSQRASILSVKEEELADINPNFTLEITQIRAFVLPTVDEEFLKTAFPEGNVKTGKEFDSWATAEIEKEMDRETEFKFVADFRDFLIRKANITLPDDFLKQWLFTINEGKFSKEEIEKDYPAFGDMMRWDLIERHYTQTLDLQVTPEEAQQEAKGVAAMQFAYYGMGNIGDEMIENYARQILGDKEQAKKIYDKLFERKIIAAVSDQVTITEKKVTAEEFNKLFEAK
ncbi:MAG: trigger factor [Rikenellaceae bacterium]|jgi:trigger factor|nr:trigger factor [Rikenellaceae bacterium]